MIHQHVLIDMNTQRDFLDAQGAAPVANRESLLPNLRKMIARVRAYHLPLISAVDSHRDSEPANPNFPKHCVDGTLGERKLAFTLLQKRVFVEANNSLDLPKNLLKHYRQVVFRRRTSDFLDNPKADRLLSELSPGLFVIFGVGLERSIRRLALCLLGRGYSVAFVNEACGYWSESEADLTRRLLVAKGCYEMTMAEVDDRFKAASRSRIKRIYSKAISPSKTRRPLAG